MYDEGEAFANGDAAPRDVDWAAVTELDGRFYELPEDEQERSWAMLELLTEMYGDDLEVL